MAVHRRAFPETGKPPVFGKKAELSVTVCIRSAIRDNTMVNSRELLKDNHSKYSPVYASIRPVSPYEFLSLINTSNMVSHFKIRVIKCPPESF
jgi:hypothetical protein